MRLRLFIAGWERADLLALVGDVYCIFVFFPHGILGQVWYLIVSFPDLCCLSYLTGNACLKALTIQQHLEFLSIFHRIEPQMYIMGLLWLHDKKYH